MEWMFDLDRRFPWLVDTRGSHLMAAMLLGFSFAFGVALAVGLLRTARSAFYTWRFRTDTQSGGGECVPPSNISHGRGGPTRTTRDVRMLLN